MEKAGYQALRELGASPVKEVLPYSNRLAYLTVPNSTPSLIHDLNTPSFILSTPSYIPSTPSLHPPSHPPPSLLGTHCWRGFEKRHVDQNARTIATGTPPLSSSYAMSHIYTFVDLHLSLSFVRYIPRFSLIGTTCTCLPDPYTPACSTPNWFRCPPPGLLTSTLPTVVHDSQPSTISSIKLLS